MKRGTSMPEEPTNETPQQPVTPTNEPMPRTTPVPPTQTPIPEQTVTSPVIAGKKKFFTKPILFGTIVAAALLILGGGGALAYNLWYQNPNKVVSDAVVNAITAKTLSATGTFDAETDDYTVKVEVAARNNLDANANLSVKLTYTADDASVTVDGEGIFSNEGDLYVKLNDAKKLVDSIEEQSSGMVDVSFLDNVITKVDSKWIKIGKDDLGEVSEDYKKTQQCFADISKSLESDKDFRKTVEKETSDLYKQHQFIVVGDKIGSRTINGQGSLGYTLSGDSAAAKSFFTKLEDTAFGKKVKECNKDIDFKDIVSDATEDEGEVKTTAEIWVSRFGHEITELKVVGEDDGTKGSFVMNPVFNKNEAIEIPTDTIPFSELQKDIEAAYQDYYTQYYSDYDSNAYESSTTSPSLYN